MTRTRRPFDAWFKMMVESWPLFFIRFTFPSLKLKVISTKLDKVVEIWKWLDDILAGQESLLVLMRLWLVISPQVSRNLLRRQRQLLAMVKDKKAKTPVKRKAVKA